MDGAAITIPAGALAATTLGSRVRELRRARGLSQTALAGDRFTKEYLSQIERGKSRPTQETVEWLAARLGVDTAFLRTGVSDGERLRAEAAVGRAEAALEANDHAGALGLLDGLAAPTAELHLRALLAGSWARMYLGELREALALAEEALALVERERLGDLDRAEALYRAACCRYRLSSIASALALYGEALALAERAGPPGDRLRAHVLEWRSRCYRRQRDFEAALDDVERALELARSLGDPATIAHVCFQASLVAERRGEWVRARAHAERARAIYEQLADRQSVGRLLNNLGGLSFLLGHPDEAVEQLKQAFAHALDVGSTPDAAQAVSSLAQVHLRTGRVELAEEQARKALELLGGRVDFLDEIGNAQLVLGRSLLEQGRLDEAQAAVADAERSFEQLSSASHRAAAWLARGDIASRRGDDHTAARLYRQAAEALQDFRF